MTMALAVALVACEAAAGKPGAPGEPGETPKLAPVIKVPFEPVALMVEGDAAEPIDVSAHFYDPEGETLTYAIAVDPAEGVVTAALAEGMLTITPVAEGSATITVTATDPDSKSTSASIAVTVAPEGMMPPVTVGTIDAVSLDVGNTHEIQDISQYFSEPEEEMLTYEVGVAPALIATAMLDGTTLTIRGDAYGVATVTVTATDEDDLSVSQEISVTVEVPKPPTPDPMPEPPMPKGTIMAQEVEVDKSLAAMDVSMYFMPTGLTYEAISSDTSKATATIPLGSSSLRISGVAIGTATVTVTATNSAGMAQQMISVTVTAASAPHKPSMVMLAGVTKMADISVGADQTVSSLDPAVVHAAPKSGSSTVWTLTGVKKGKAMVRVWHADQTIDVTIAVTVENTPPKKIPSAPTVIVPTTDGTADVHQHVDAKGNVSDAPGAVQIAPAPGADKRLYHKVLFAFSDYFGDADGSGLTDIDDKTGYKARSNVPEVDIVKVLKDGVVIDVKKDVGSVFPLVIYVVDKDGAMSEEVTISANSPTPLADMYEVRQDQGDGDFGAETVHLRQGVNHTLTFAAFGADREAGDNRDGFNFIHVFEADQLAGYMLEGVEVAQADLVMVPSDGLPSATADTPPNPAAYLAVAKTGNVEIKGGTPARGLAIGSDNVPTLTFSVTGSGIARVTVTYHRLVGKDGAERKWMPDSETLTMTIR